MPPRNSRVLRAARARVIQIPPLAHALPPEGFVRLPRVLGIFDMGKSTVWAMVKSGTFPKPHKIGPRVTAWNVADLREFIRRHQSAAIEA